MLWRHEHVSSQIIHAECCLALPWAHMFISELCCGAVLRQHRHMCSQQAVLWLFASVAWTYMIACEPCQGTMQLKCVICVHMWPVIQYHTKIAWAHMITHELCYYTLLPQDEHMCLHMSHAVVLCLSSIRTCVHIQSLPWHSAIKAWLYMFKSEPLHNIMLCWCVMAALA